MQRPDLNTVINSAFTGLRAQINTARELAAGASAGILDTLLSETGLLNIHHQSLTDAASAEADDYNELIGEVERRDEQISNLQLKAESKEAELRQARADRDGAVADKAEMAAALASSEARLALEQDATKQLSRERITLAKELKNAQSELEGMERLRKQNKAKQQELVELRKAADQLRATNIQIRNDRAETEKRLADLVKDNLRMKEELENARLRLMDNDGSVINKTYEGEDGVAWYVYQFNFGLRYHRCGDMDLVGDLEWHAEIRTTTGHCALVLVDEYLRPEHPDTSHYTGAVPGELLTDLQELILRRCQDSHPDHYQRHLWARDTGIETLGMTTQLTNKLISLGYCTVLDLLSATVAQLAKHPGLGDKTARHACEQARSAARIWMKERKDELRRQAKQEKAA
ncbi:hypothetical protein PU634_04945 [Oceanimonas pelagia]|uniref:Uncharacterized protein n=1 Tax=Oceanimonas pelagia TaxID=3028314 RepID=A0AA50KQ87_9GAMM|nr:helix-hairpin-helix domain-containing protein [Oceanimonas pelagia]WMC11714.1 hypothetical protein PU634_04945 [Oceanimonas pelagia]